MFVFWFMKRVFLHIVLHSITFAMSFSLQLFYQTNTPKDNIKALYYVVKFFYQFFYNFKKIIKEEDNIKKINFLIHNYIIYATKLKINYN